MLLKPSPNLKKIAKNCKKNSVVVLGLEVSSRTNFEALAFSALTLLVGRQEGHPACKN